MDSGLRQWLRDPEKWLHLLTLAGGLAAFGFGLREYREEQRWKRLEYFTGLLQAIEAEPEVRDALRVLEYNQPRVCAREEAAADPARRCFAVTDSLMVKALDASMQNRVLTDQEHQVIYGLDRLLTALDRIDYLQDAGVRHRGDAAPDGRLLDLPDRRPSGLREAARGAREGLRVRSLLRVRRGAEPGGPLHRAGPTRTRMHGGPTPCLVTLTG